MPPDSNRSRIKAAYARIRWLAAYCSSKRGFQQLYRHNVFRGIIVLAVPFLTVTMLDPALSPFSDPLLGLLNTLPVFLLTALLWCLTRRFLLSTTLAAGATAFLFTVNRLKFRELQDVLVPHDVRLIGQVLTNAEFFVRYTRWGVIALLVGAAGLATVAALARFEPADPRLTPLRRFAGGSLIVVMLLMMTQPGNPASWPFERLNTDPRPTTSARTTGLIVTLVRVTTDMSRELPQFDEGVVADFNRRYPPESATNVESRGPLPDIVVVMSESYFDPSVLRGVGEVPQLKAFRAIAAGATSGALAVPTGAGGGTMRTEFEFLTGTSLRHLPSHPYPYYSLIRPGFPSLPNILRGLGYQTIAMHPHRPTFWNRNIAYPDLGFDVFLSERSFERKRDGFFISDRALVNRIIHEMDEEAPQFIFAVSIEGHGPWTNRPVSDTTRRDAISVPGVLSPEDAVELKNVIYHLENTSEALRQLHVFVESRERPTVLLFFGDHLPTLNGVYETLGFDSGRSAAEQTVPYLLTANYSIEKQQVDTCPYFLASLVLDAARLDAGPAFSWNRRLLDSVRGFATGGSRLHCALPEELDLAQYHLQTGWITGR